MTRIWIDIDDLFQYAASGVPRPSGIQRVVFELCQALVARWGDGNRLGFVRHDPPRNGFMVVDWSEAAALFEALTTEPAASTRRASPAIVSDSALRRRLKRAAYRLPDAIRLPLLRMVRAQLQVFREILALGRGLRGSGRARQKEVVQQGRDFAEVVRPGDIFLAPGSPWGHPDYAGLLRGLQQRHGARTVVLIYDIIPARHPEWCDRGLVRLFRPWLDGVLPVADSLMAISRATAEDVASYARRRGIPLNGPVSIVPMGSGFGAAQPDSAAPSPRLPTPGSYVLFVSTIEPRKNHVLLMRVWQRLLNEMPVAAVPTLVFAGRVGWLVADLMQQLDNTDWLDGRIVLVQDPSDAELAALYRGCLFTVFPSLYEGWGLPVTESLAFGKPCIASNVSAVPEAGGALTRYFDPECVADATRVIRAVIEDRAGLAEWEERVRREFRPEPWAAAADALVAALRQEAAAAG